jgi:hypothetical protein
MLTASLIATLAGRKYVHAWSMECVSYSSCLINKEADGSCLYSIAGVMASNWQVAGVEKMAREYDSHLASTCMFETVEKQRIPNS